VTSPSSNCRWPGEDEKGICKLGTAQDALHMLEESRLNRS